MIDLVIINPSASHGIYGELGDTLTACEPPLWCRLIAGYIRDQGFSVKIIDAEALNSTVEKVGWYVETIKPRLICIAVYGHQPSASTQQMVGASLIARYLKNSTNTSHIPIIMVGGHVSALPERTFEKKQLITLA
jgi:anaerobic magnesium-protoporphyrin IX monomethyl ester cyclase